MTREFIPHEEALALRELGFDEPCFGHYEDGVFIFWYDSRQESEFLLNCTAPLYQQAFRWFREKYGLDSWVYRPDEKLNIWGYNTTLHNNVAPFKTYEEAELACLKQLIKIVKEKK